MSIASANPNIGASNVCDTISIYNAAGQFVLQHAVTGDALIEINVTSLPKGFYVGTATLDGNKTASFKFVK